MSALLGLRLVLAGGRENLARLALTGLGVALGVVLLLLSLAGQSALRGRAERSAWQDTLSSTQATAADPALWLGVSDHYAGEPLHRAHIAPLGPQPPIPPGLDRLPAPGEVAVSPALRRLLATTPDDQLDNRFPGRVTMTIGPAGLRHPDQLVAVVGHAPQQMRQMGGAQEVRGIETRPFDGPNFDMMRFALMLGAILLLGPVVAFIIMVTRIAAARREQRLAAVRMVGATRLQTAVMAAAETGLGSAAGAAAGWLGYLVARPILAANVSYGDYQGGRFFSADVTVPLDQMIGVLVGVPVLAMITTVLSLHRVQVTPLGISRRAHLRPPTAWRALPVTVGIVGFVIAAVTLRDRPDRILGSGAQLALLGSLLCTLVGAVIIGPWACLLVSRALARCSRQATTLMAARRIAADPRGSYRAVSGVALAVFVATLLAGLFSIAEDTAGAQFDVRHRPGVVEIYAGGQPATRLAPLMSDRVVVARGEPGRPISVACAELTQVVDVTCPLPPGLGSAWSMPSTATIAMSATGGGLVEPGPGDADLPVHSLYVPTDGTIAAEERVRTQATSVLPRAIVSTRRDTFYREDRFFADLGTGVRLATLFVVLMAGCSLTVFVISGLIERRRPFALLRASGVGLGELRRTALLETAVPMVSTVHFGAGLGLVPGYAFSIIEEEPWPAPGLDFVVSLGGGVLAALAITVVVALPLMDATTRYNAIRFE